MRVPSRHRRGVVVTAVTVAVVAIAIFLARPGPIATAPAGVLAGLARQCASSVGPEGFGRAVISKPLRVVGETAEITVPCRFLLQRGGRLTLERTHLRTRHLYVSDDSMNGATSVDVLTSTITGVDASGFQLDLADPDDHLSVQGSTIDYALSVWATVGAGGGGRVEISDTVLRSQDPHTQGISILASENGGVATFTNVALEAPPEATRLLFAGQCAMVGVTGGPPRCSL